MFGEYKRFLLYSVDIKRTDQFTPFQLIRATCVDGAATARHDYIDALMSVHALNKPPSCRAFHAFSNAADVTFITSSKKNNTDESTFFSKGANGFRGCVYNFEFEFMFIYVCMFTCNYINDTC